MGLAAVNRQPSSCWYEPSISLRNEEQRELVLAAPEADVEGKLTEDDIRWEKAELVRLEKRLLEDCSAVGSSVKAAYVIAETGAFWTSIHRELSEKARMKHGGGSRFPSPQSPNRCVLPVIFTLRLFHNHTGDMKPPKHLSHKITAMSTRQETPESTESAVGCSLGIALFGFSACS